MNTVCDRCARPSEQTARIGYVSAREVGSSSQKSQSWDRSVETTTVTTVFADFRDGQAHVCHDCCRNWLRESLKDGLARALQVGLWVAGIPLVVTLFMGLDECSGSCEKREPMEDGAPAG